MYDLTWYYQNHLRIIREVAAALGATVAETESLTMNELFQTAKELGVKIEG